MCIVLLVMSPASYVYVTGLSHKSLKVLICNVYCSLSHKSRLVNAWCLLLSQGQKPLVIIQSMGHYRHVLIGTKNCCWKTLVIYGSQSFLCVTDRKDQSLYVFIKTNLKQIMKSVLSKKYSLI